MLRREGAPRKKEQIVRGGVGCEIGREPPFRRLLMGSCGRVDVSAATSTLTDDVGERGGGVEDGERGVEI